MSKMVVKIWKYLNYFPFILLAIKFVVCEAIVCYKCDSLALEACATTLNDTDLPYVTCKSTQCAMSIVETITYRGCSDTTPVAGATYRKYCTGNLCNKGVYPPGRLKCYQCNGEDCDGVVGKPHPCPNHLEMDECYIDAIEITQIYRGCRSSTNYTLSSRALFCDYNGCNNDLATSKLRCAQCDSKLKRGCKRDFVQQNNITQYEICEMDVKINTNSSCFIYNNLDQVLRGCSEQMPTEVKENPNRTLLCTGPDFCNVANLDIQQCLVCNSRKGDDKCRFDVSSVATTYCSSPEASSCYAIEYTDWHVERGCGAMPQNNTDQNRVYECDSPINCNVKAFTRCYKCTSEQNPNCATWQRPGILDIEECEIPGANCLTATLADGITRRGCESPQLNCSHTPMSHCHICQGSFCNRNPFPPERLQCYQCGTLENDCLETFTRDPLPCPLSEVEPNDNVQQACFEYFSVQMGHNIRGCATDGYEYYKCMLQAQPECKLCTTNGCNNVLNDQFTFKKLPVV